MSVSHLTAPLRDLLEAHAALSQFYGTSPSVRQLQTALKLGSTNAVNDRLSTLERLGFVERTAYAARSTKLTAAGREALGQDYGVLIPVPVAADVPVHLWRNHRRPHTGARPGRSR